jgi:hypothetical protein
MTGVYFVQFEHRLYPGDSGFDLGIFSTFDKANDHVTHLKTQPGFSEAPGRFSIEFWGFDRVVWKSGFVFPEREHGRDIPLWAMRRQPQAGETAKAYAKRLCDRRFGGGLYHMGPTSEYAQLKKRMPASRPGVESNHALAQFATMQPKAVAAVWELSHEHEFRDAGGFFSDQGKFLGFFTSRERARDAKRALMREPGFRETAGGFYYGRSQLDCGQWCEGFVTYSA